MILRSAFGAPRQGSPKAFSCPPTPTPHIPRPVTAHCSATASSPPVRRFHADGRREHPLRLRARHARRPVDRLPVPHRREHVRRDLRDRARRDHADVGRGRQPPAPHPGRAPVRRPRGRLRAGGPRHAARRPLRPAPPARLLPVPQHRDPHGPARRGGARLRVRPGPVADEHHRGRHLRPRFRPRRGAAAPSHPAGTVPRGGRTDGGRSRRDGGDRTGTLHPPAPPPRPARDVDGQRGAPVPLRPARPAAQPVGSQRPDRRLRGPVHPVRPGGRRPPAGRRVRGCSSAT